MRRSFGRKVIAFALAISLSVGSAGVSTYAHGMTSSSAEIEAEYIVEETTDAAETTETAETTDKTVEAAETTDEGEIGEAAVKASESAVEERDEIKLGYTIDGAEIMEASNDATPVNEADEETATPSDADVEEVTESVNDNVVTMNITDTITGTLTSDGVLTITGTGELPDYSRGAAWRSAFIYGTNKLVIKDGITKIGEATFYDFNITEVDIASTVKSLGAGCFANCPISKVSGMKGVTTISEYAFQGSKFTKFEFPANVTSVSNYIFYDNSALTEIVIPASVKSLGAITLGTKNLTTITVADTNSYYKSTGGILYSKDGKTLVACPCKKTSVSIPSGVTKLAAYSFTGTNCSSVTIPSTVTELGAGVFYRSNITKLVIPDRGKSIGDFLCQECTSLESVATGNGLTSIEYRAFKSCTSLKNVTIGSSVKSIETGAFTGCTSLSTVTIPKNVSNIDSGAFPETTTLNILNPKLVKNSYGEYIELANATFNVEYNYDYAYEILDLVNKERASNGLSALKMDKDLLEAAMLRAAEINAYFDHTRPDGTRCFSACSKMNAENIAANYNPTGTMNAWMNSSGHRANILSSGAKSIGIGAAKVNGNWYFVQCFSSQDADVASRSSYSNGKKLTKVSFETGENMLVKLVEAHSDNTVYPGSTIEAKLYFYNDFQNILVDSSSYSTKVVSGSSVTSDGSNVLKAVSAGTSTVRLYLKSDSSVYVDASYTVDSVPANLPSSVQISKYNIWNERDLDGDVYMYATFKNKATGIDYYEYRYSYFDNSAQKWIVASDWSTDKSGAWITPTGYGTIKFKAEVRVTTKPATTVEFICEAEFHPFLKGVCQMPNPYGSGYLIGLETYEGKAEAVKCEMLILDCTKYAMGQNAWTYSSGKVPFQNYCRWMTWDPLYGYYWTLFRVYDGSGKLIDEICYGFANI